MIVYRITNHPELDGEGAARQLNNRWNSLGTRMVYCSGSIALAKGELSRRTPLNLLPGGFEILHIDIPDGSILSPYAYPDNWDEVPPGVETKSYGDHFVQKREYLGLKVPSAFDKNGFNFLLNPQHPEFEKVKVVQREPIYI